MQSFRNFKVWGKAHELTPDIHRCSRNFPREKLYGLTSQMRRAAISTGANIAEGCYRKGDVELGRFLQITMGSASELEYELPLAGDVGLPNREDFQRLESKATEVKRMLAALIRKLKPES